MCLERTNAFSSIGSTLPLHSSALYSALSDSDSHNHLHQRREFVIQSIIATGIASSVILPFAEPALADDKIDPSIDLPKITQKVYLDIKFAKYKPKKLVIGLFGDAMPKTVENFLTLCTNTSGPSYNGATFYRALSGMSIQGGAIGSNTNGKSGTSAFEGGLPFPPDNFNILHQGAGLVSAVRGVNGEIDSRFFIQTEKDAGWADDRFAAFGIVLEDEEGTGGMDLVKRISKVDVTRPQNSPNDPVEIVGCGIV